MILGGGKFKEVTKVKYVRLSAPKFLVLKWQDINKYLSQAEIDVLNEIIEKIGKGRVADKKTPFNLYLVVNIDEPYAAQVFDVMRKHGHVPCSDCHESQKEIFCKPGGCRWYELKVK